MMLVWIHLFFLQAVSKSSIISRDPLTRFSAVIGPQLRLVLKFERWWVKFLTAYSRDYGDPEKGKPGLTRPHYYYYFQNQKVE